MGAICHFVDFDGDGDYDCVARSTPGYAHEIKIWGVYENIGTPYAPVFSQTLSRPAWVSVIEELEPSFTSSNINELSFVDYDSDGTCHQS